MSLCNHVSILVGALLACGLVAGSASGQSISISSSSGVISSSSSEVIFINGMPTVVEMSDEMPPEMHGARPAEGGKPKSRLERLSQLKFDRRPAAVLAAWQEANRPANATKPKPAAKPVPKPLVEPPTSETPQPPDLKPEDPAKSAKAAAGPDPLDAEMKAFQSHVTLGRWSAVKKYLAMLPEVERKAAWRQLLTSLASPPMNHGMHNVPSEPNVWTADDLLGLASVRPDELDTAAITSLGRILAGALQRDLAVEPVVARLERALKTPAEGEILSRRQAALLLQAAGRPQDTIRFLPALDEAIASGDGEALKLLSLHFAASRDHRGAADDLERAWRANLAVLAIAQTTPEQEQEALARLIGMAQQVRKELGQAWLDESFVDRSERGMRILSLLGTTAAQAFAQHPQSPEERLKPLKLQKTAVAALLKANPERARQWSSALRLLALNWVREAEYSRTHDHSSGMGNRMQSDRFGNIFFGSMDSEISFHDHNQPRPIVSDELLEQAPGDDWVAVLDEGVRVPTVGLRAELLLKLNREEQAFPIIEQLAPNYPDRALKLAEEFLRAWQKSHDPNGRQERFMNPYANFYGFNDQAQSIPLTRSKQERNLIELAEWVVRLKKLSLPRLDEALFAEAFTACHSNAEVYRIDAIVRVFGPIDQLKPRTISSLGEQMRRNLAGLWRAPKVQEVGKTKRKTKDIEAEVLRGYGTARELVTGALAKYPDDWSLQLAQAALELDESNFRHELEKDPTFQERRKKAMAGFARAAELYAAAAPRLSEDQESTQVFEQWFYAGLGACDLESVDDDKQPDPKQTPLVRAALAALPGDFGRRHRDRFAAQMFTQLRSVKPAIKFRYLREGFAVVGDHPLAQESRKVYNYYQDLVTEIKLEAQIDGMADGVVGHTQPFGVLVSLVHSPEIERESGGFGRFLQNQNSGGYGYNYGRPTVDYRDRFTASAQEALKENYEVVSITFESDKVRPRESARAGWRSTAYAFLLIKARGPHVDRLPPLKLDLDFLDTSGYVVLPVESPAVPLDAKPKQGSPRPIEKAAVAQILDERRAEEGLLLLEVKASARGLVPDLDQLVDLRFDGFQVGKIDDRGLAVSKFDAESPRTAVLSERSWLVSLDADRRTIAPETPFKFAAARDPKIEMTWQRYQDADIETVVGSISLQSRYGKREVPWRSIAAGSAATLIVIVVSIFALRRARRAIAPLTLRLPDPLTPFAVLDWLETMKSTAPLSESQRRELTQAISRLEDRYFAEENLAEQPRTDGDAKAAGDAECREIAEHWLRVARNQAVDAPTLIAALR